MDRHTDTSTTELVDSHCHLTFDALAENVDRVFALSAELGVRRFVTVGTDIADSRAALKLARQYDGIWATAGVHPHEAGKTDESTWTELVHLLELGEAVALGETGLDYHYDFSDHASQRNAFARQIELAERFDLPLVIHCRDAVDDALALLAETKARGPHGVFHCFTGTAAEAARILNAGWYISLAGIVTFKNAHDLREAAKAIPIDRLLLETDAPYNSPEPVRKVRPNIPGHVAHTCAFLASLRRIATPELAARCNENAQALFRLRGGSPR